MDFNINFKEKVIGAYTRILRTALNKTWKQHLTNKEIYGKIQKITNSIREQRLRFAGNFRRSKNELTSDLLLWQPLHGKRSRGRPSKIIIDQLIEDTGFTLDELPTAIYE